MNYKYKITIDSPEGQIIVSANETEQLQRIITRNGFLGMAGVLSGGDLESQYLKYQKAFPPARKTNRQSRIYNAGLEKEVLSLYLKRKQLAEARDILLERYDFETSKSSLSRYWVRFSKCGIIPAVVQGKER